MIKIKKYSNRRLYNTKTKKYIRLDDILNMCSEQIAFEVVEVKTKLDITRSILIQAMLEKNLFNMDGWSIKDIKDTVNNLLHNNLPDYKNNIKNAFLDIKPDIQENNIINKEIVDDNKKPINKLSLLWKSMTYSKE